MVKRAGWGADLAAGGCPPRGPAEYGVLGAAVVHHTVNANDYTPEEAPGIVLGICRFHVYGNGWNDIGYNALVDRYGTVYEGRAGGLKLPVVGAQAQGFNSQTTSIASIGDHTLEPITPEATRSIIRYLSWRLGRCPRDAGDGHDPADLGRRPREPLPRRNRGHRAARRRPPALGLTACPGTLDAQLPAIRPRSRSGSSVRKSQAKRKCPRKRKGKKCKAGRKPAQAALSRGPVGGKKPAGAATSPASSR